MLNLKQFYDPILVSFNENKINIDETVDDLFGFYKSVKDLIVDNAYIKNSKIRMFFSRELKERF